MRVLFVFFCRPETPFSASVAALSAVVRAAGHEPACLSLPLSSRIDDAVRAIADAQPDVLAVTAMSRDWPGARSLIERLPCDPWVVVGGYHASLATHDVAACDAVDAICIGEGERPLAALLDRLAVGEPGGSLPGLWVRGAEGLTEPIPAADPVSDIAALLPWDYDVFGDVRALLDRGINTFGPLSDRFLPTRASRGCPYACAYCSAPAWGRTAAFERTGARNVRPVGHLCDELASLRDRYAPAGFEFWDEHFPIDVGWLSELAREYPKRVGLPFKVEMHPSAATRERLALLAQAGCVLFHCGVETGDAALRRDVLRRRARDEVIARVFNDARELGLETSASVMTALPTETHAQAMSTVELLRKVRPGSFMWSTYAPLPGTPLGDAAVQERPTHARERFDDHPPIESRTPPRMTEDERRSVYEAFAALQSELVAAAARDTEAPRPRPIATPADDEEEPRDRVSSRMQSYKGRFEPTRFEDLTVTVDFHCHSACRFCIVQEGMNLFKGVPFEKFKQVVDDNGRAPRYRRVTFTGGEVTLERRLFDYIEHAHVSGGFEHIRLQTNGRLLADASFAARLVEAGVDEFFVSLHGPDAATQDYISQRPGSFDEAMAGLRNLRDLGACIMTNTVITTLNVARLADIVDTVKEIHPARMELWNYLPMEDHADQRGLIAPIAEVGASVRAMISRAAPAGIPVAVKYVPQCLLGEHASSMDNTQPDVVIAEDFYEVYPQFACLYEAKCAHSETCLGLHHPYIEKYGWERDLLSPTPRTEPWREPEYGPSVPSDDPRGGVAPARAHPEWFALVEGVAEAHGGALSELTLDRRQCLYRFVTAAGSAVDVVLTARSETEPALLRTRSFNLHYRNVVGDEREALTKIVKAAAERIRERDTGAMLLDDRKGLVGVEALRRPRRR